MVREITENIERTLGETAFDGTHRTHQLIEHIERIKRSNRNLQRGHPA